MTIVARMRWTCVLAAISALAPITSGCGGPQERSTTIPAMTRRSAPRVDAHDQAVKVRRLTPSRHLVPGEIWGRRFVAVSFVRRGDRPKVEPVPHTHFSFWRARFAGQVRGSIEWNDGCNGFGGPIRVRGTEMRVAGVAGTMKACMELRPGRKPRSTERGPLLMNFFGGKMRWRLHDGRLVLSRGTQTLLLRETRS